MNKVDPKYKCLELEPEPDNSYTPNYFIVKLVDRKYYRRYQKTFYNYKDAYDFYLERLEEKESLWSDVWIMEVSRKRINPEMYAVMSGLSY